VRRTKPQHRKKRVQVYLSDSDLQYVNAIKDLVCLRSNSEAVRFCIRLLRLLLPKANLVVEIVAKLLENETSRQ